MILINSGFRHEVYMHILEKFKDSHDATRNSNVEYCVAPMLLPGSPQEVRRLLLIGVTKALSPEL